MIDICFLIPFGKLMGSFSSVLSEASNQRWSMTYASIKITNCRDNVNRNMILGIQFLGLRTFHPPASLMQVKKKKKNLQLQKKKKRVHVIPRIL